MFGKINNNVANINTVVHISLNVISTYLKKDKMWLTARDSLCELADSVNPGETICNKAD